MVDSITSDLRQNDTRALDEARDIVLGALLESGATPVMLPAKYRLDGTFGGTRVDLDLRVFRGGPFAWARVTRMRSEGRVEALNVVLVPTEDSNAPCVGVEILSFVRGVHLVVFDVWPTSGHGGKAASCLAGLRERLDQEWELEPPPEWGREVFSHDAIVIRPGARAEVSAYEFVEPLEELITVVCGTEWHEPADPERHLERRRKWLRVQGEEEPAGKFLARIGGEEWVERFTFEVLYPTWLYDGDGDPPWRNQTEAKTIDLRSK